MKTILLAVVVTLVTFAAAQVKHAPSLAETENVFLTLLRKCVTDGGNLPRNNGATTL